MPQTLSAKKALRQAQRKKAVNQKVKLAYKNAIRQVREKKDKSSLVKAFSLLDQAAKKGVIHKRKAARLKSRLSRFIAKVAKITPSNKKKSKKAAPKRR